MMMVLVKLTVLPLASVSRPSSRICSRMLKTSLCAFSISSSRIRRIGLAFDRFGQLAALLIADVAGRGADQLGHRVLFHVFGHVDAHHGLFAVEHEFAQGLGQLGLAHAGRPEKNERAQGAVRVLQPGPGAAQDARDRFHGLVLADDPLLQYLLHVQQLLFFPAQQLADRDAGPLGDHFGDVLLGDLLGQDLLFLLQDGKLFLDAFALFLLFRQSPVLDLRGQLVIVAPLGVLLLQAQPVGLLLEVAQLVDQVLLLLPVGLDLVALDLQLRRDRPAAPSACPWRRRCPLFSGPGARSPAG